MDKSEALQKHQNDEYTVLNCVFLVPLSFDLRWKKVVMIYFPLSYSYVGAAISCCHPIFD